MKYAIIILLLNTLVTFGQEKEQFELLDADPTWFKETIKFPIKFAQEIKYQGFADLRFAPNFTKQQSPELWSYIWAWSITSAKQLTVSDLENDLTHYFDGLMGINNEHNTAQTNALLLKKELPSGKTHFIGKVKTFDTKYTKNKLTLQVKIEQNVCEKENKTIYLFRFSTQDYNHIIWQELQNINLLNTVCTK